MNCLMEIEKKRETKLKLAKIEDGFYNIIGGQRSAAARKLSVINPATGKELATVPAIVAASLDDAVDAARKAFPAWRALPLARRKKALSEVLTEIDRYAEELSVLLTAEQGRPLLQARWEIDLLSKVYGPAFTQMDIPKIEQKVTHIGHVSKRYTPIGVVGAISPWNALGATGNPFICQSTPCAARGKHRCPKAVTVYATYRSPNFRLHS